jgi:hypothetical protein
MSVCSIVVKRYRGDILPVFIMDLGLMDFVNHSPVFTSLLESFVRLVIGLGLGSRADAIDN